MAKAFLSSGLGVAPVCMIMTSYVLCSIGCLAFFGPCDVKVKPGG